MNFWKNKKQLTQMHTEILRLKAENEQLSFDKHKLEHRLKRVERQNYFLSRITEITNRHELVVKSFPQREKTYSVAMDAQYNWKGQLIGAHFYLYILEDEASPPKWYNHLWIEPQYRKEKTLEWLEYIEITEFLGKEEELGKGYGSLNLSVMLEFVKETFGEKTTVKGKLSLEDERDGENKKRRDHVYKKFGFRVEGEWVILDHLSQISNKK